MTRHLPVLPQQLLLADLDDFGRDSAYASSDLHCRDFWDPNGPNECPIISCRYHLFADRNGLINADVEEVAEHVATMPVKCMWDALRLARMHGVGEFGAASQEQTAELLGLRRTAYQDVEEKTLGLWNADKQKFERTPKHVAMALAKLRHLLA